MTLTDIHIKKEFYEENKEKNIDVPPEQWNKFLHTPNTRDAQPNNRRTRDIHIGTFLYK